MDGNDETGNEVLLNAEFADEKRMANVAGRSVSETGRFTGMTRELTTISSAAAGSCWRSKPKKFPEESSIKSRDGSRRIDRPDRHTGNDKRIAEPERLF